LKRFPKLEWEIEFIAQPTQVSRQTVTRVCNFLP
jgi:hypothetical protein